MPSNKSFQLTKAFVMALATRLASEVCFTLTESAQKASQLFEEYEKLRLPRAKSFDSKQGTPHGVIQDAWENARRSGLGESSDQSSWNGYFPVS